MLRVSPSVRRMSLGQTANGAGSWTAFWQSDMRRTLGDIRNIQFTFYYY